VVNYSIQMEALILNRPKTAIDAFGRLPLHDRDRRYNAWRLEAYSRALHALGNYERELTETRRAQTYQPGNLSYLASETRALAALGRVDAVHRVVDDSLSVPSAQGSPASVMESAARELRAHGHRRESVAVATRGVEWLRSRPRLDSSAGGHRAALGRMLYLAEQWDDSLVEFSALAAEHPGSVEYTGYLGVLAARLGESQRARSRANALQNLDVPNLHGRHTYWRACIASILGEKERAVALLREAFGQGQYLGLQIHQSPHLELLNDFPAFRKLVEPRE
jgi:tetratricopeptide (TPR) repeat protein